MPSFAADEADKLKSLQGSEKEIQALLPERPRWLLQLVIEIAGIAVFGIMAAAVARHVGARHV